MKMKWKFEVKKVLYSYLDENDNEILAEGFIRTAETNLEDFYEFKRWFIISEEGEDVETIEGTIVKILE